jgi:hypothetical protein
MWGLLVAEIIGAFAKSMSSWAFRVLLAVGIGFVTYKGSDVAISAMRDAAISSVRGLPADALGLIGFLWLDKALSIIFSAVAASIAVRGIGSSVKKVALK